MGFDNDCILYYRDISKQYFCAVCRTLVYPNEAMQAPCTHLYCKMCLAYVVSTTHACPYDGCRVTEADSKPLLESNVMMAATIGKIPVRCLYYRTGCTWKGSLSDCTIHFPNCAFGDSTVACGNCGILMKHRQVHEHGQNCSGVQSQVQQPSGVSESTSAGTAAGAMVAVSAISGPNHTATAVAAGDSASLVSNQVTNQLANSVTQPPVAQAAMPTPEQYYQPQMQLDQQYYQLYQGYEPYQYSYQYPQVAQQYQPQQTQGHLQFQPIVQTQQQVPPEVPPQGAQTDVNAQPFVQLQGLALPLVQANGQAQPQMQTYGQAQPNAQAHFQTHTQAMGLGQAPMPHALSYSQAQPLLQAQPYTQPQLVPEQQQLQLPQLVHTHPQMQPYPQFQTHEYPHPQRQVHSLPHTQPNLQPFVHPPQQPLLHSAQLPTPNAVSGYQSYPQPQFRAVPPTHVAGAQWQVQYPDQMLGQFPLQAPQMPPPQAYSDVQSQQQSATLFAQGHPSAQHPHMQAQQPEYQFQQRPGMQSAQQVAPQEYGQQQSSPAQRPLMQHSHSMIGQVRQPQLNKNYPVEIDNEALTARQHAAQSQRVSSAEKSHNRMIEKTVHNRLNASKKAKHTNDQAWSAKQNVDQSQQVSSIVKSHHPMMEKSVHNHMNTSKEARDMAMITSEGSKEAKDMTIISSEGSREAPDTAMISSEGNMDGVVKLKAQNNLMVNTDGNEGENFLGSNKQMDDVETKVDNQVYEVKPREKGDPREGVSKTPCDAIKSGEKDPVDGFKSGSKEPVDGFKKAEVKYTPRHNPPSSTLRKSSLGPQVHGENSDKKPVDGFKKAEVKYTPRHKPPSSTLCKSPLGPQVHGENSNKKPVDGFKKAEVKYTPRHKPPSSTLCKSPLGPQVHGENSEKKPIDGFKKAEVKYTPRHNPPSSTLCKSPLGPQVHGENSDKKPVDGFKKAEVKYTPRHNPPSSTLRKSPLGPQVHGENSDKKPVDGFKKAVVYTPRHKPPSSTSRKSLLESQVHDENPSGVSGPADINPRQSNLPPHQTTQPQNHSNSPQFEERQAHPIGPTEHNSFRPGLHGNQPRAMKFDNPSALDPNPAHRTSSRMPDNRVMPFPEEQFKCIPRTEFEDNSRRFPRPRHLKYGPSSNYGTEFPSSGPLDGNNMPRSFEQDPAVGMDVTGFGPSRLLPPSHPKDAGGWAHASTNDNMGRTKFSQPEFSGPGFGRGGDYPTHKSRFPVPPRVDFGARGNLRVGDEHLTPHQDLMPNSLPRGEGMVPWSSHLGEVTAFGRPGEPSWIEPPLGNFQPPVPFHDSFAGENVGHPLQGEPGFGNGYDFQHAHDGGFYPREMNSVGNLRLQKPGSIMCLLCKVECGSVEGLDLHSQSKEHQQIARDIVSSIKQQNTKKQKVFKDEASAGIGRDAGGPRKPEF